MRQLSAAQCRTMKHPWKCNAAQGIAIQQQSKTVQRYVAQWNETCWQCETIAVRPTGWCAVSSTWSSPDGGGERCLRAHGNAQMCLATNWIVLFKKCRCFPSTSVTVPRCGAPCKCTRRSHCMSRCFRHSATVWHHASALVGPIACRAASVTVPLCGAPCKCTRRSHCMLRCFRHSATVWCTMQVHSSVPLQLKPRVRLARRRSNTSHQFTALEMRLHPGSCVS
jgi:hypothetical protein